MNVSACTLYPVLQNFHYTAHMQTSEQPWRQNLVLRFSYSLIAPLYDAVIEGPMRKARQRSLRLLPETSGRVLLSGVGTGLDLPLLPAQHHYTALDFNAAMLRRAVARGKALDVDFVLGDSMNLPFADGVYDCVVLHLIVAVVPEPQACLSEAARVLRPGGLILLFDKFLRPGKLAPLRRLFNPLTRRLATRMDVVFEAELAKVPELEILSDGPALAGGWFRSIVLRKTVKANV